MSVTVRKGYFKLAFAAAAMGFMIFAHSGMSAKAIDVIPNKDNPTKPADENGKEFVYKNYGNYIDDLLKVNDVLTFKAGEEYTLPYAIKIPQGRNITINAEGATIIIQKGAVANADFTIGGYGAVSGLTINGGTWKSADGTGGKTSAIKIAQGQNITLKNMTIECTSAGNHSVELIACKNVLVENCKIAPVGSSSGKEEQLQIDLASPATAGNVLSGAALDGSTCQNVKIINCEVTGNRGIGINADVKNAKGAGKQSRGKYQNKYHKNIEVAGCTITGKKAEGVMAYNVIGLNIHDNSIASEASAKKENYSSGIHALNQGKGGKMTLVIKNNTVKGGKQAIFVGSNGAKIKKATVTNNQASSKKGEGIVVRDCKKWVVKKNK